MVYDAPYGKSKSRSSTSVYSESDGGFEDLRLGKKSKSIGDIRRSPKAGSEKDGEKAALNSIVAEIRRSQTTTHRNQSAPSRSKTPIGRRSVETKKCSADSGKRGSRSVPTTPKKEKANEMSDNKKKDYKGNIRKDGSKAENSKAYTARPKKSSLAKGNIPRADAAAKARKGLSKSLVDKQKGISNEKDPEELIKDEAVQGYYVYVHEDTPPQERRKPFALVKPTVPTDSAVQDEEKNRNERVPKITVSPSSVEDLLAESF